MVRAKVKLEDFQKIYHFILKISNQNEISAGGASVNFQMLNKESRKYFHRSFVASGTALNSYRFNDNSNVQLMQNCTKIDDMDKIIEYLKTANGSSIAMCNFLGRAIWSPTIECINAPKAFLTKTPEDIYMSEKSAPNVDAMFSFNSQEAIQFRPRLLELTEPLLKVDPNETNVLLPFKGFTKKDYPQVSNHVCHLIP